MSDILKAARSYYGLADIDSCTTQLFTNQEGKACVAFEIPLSPEDFIVIGERMKAMQEAESQQRVDVSSVSYTVPNSDELRKAYNALSKEERGRYGSFARFVAEASNYIMQVEDEIINGTSDIKNPVGLMASMEAEGRNVAHIDAPETEEPTKMDSVWLTAEEANRAQREHCIDAQWDKGYLVPWSMLTEEQRQKAKEKL